MTLDVILDAEQQRIQLLRLESAAGRRICRKANKCRRPSDFVIVTVKLKAILRPADPAPRSGVFYAIKQGV
ncbi:hypothetical protein AUJ65_03090 [Candidatus Micrarchaeota archaeon CG1_02_51_15]|nr:MAG: hypothetical protein AUJ65_03090 [Candidatus Micrarchaeota archaeon CG1_02_51_15]